MSPPDKTQLVEKYRKEVHSLFTGDTPQHAENCAHFEEVHFPSMVAGWALAQGLSPKEAIDITYKHDMY